MTNIDFINHFWLKLLPHISHFSSLLKPSAFLRKEVTNIDSIHHFLKSSLTSLKYSSLLKRTAFIPWREVAILKKWRKESVFITSKAHYIAFHHSFRHFIKNSSLLKIFVTSLQGNPMGFRSDKFRLFSSLPLKFGTFLQGNAASFRSDVFFSFRHFLKL